MISTNSSNGELQSCSYKSEDGVDLTVFND